LTNWRKPLLIIFTRCRHSLVSRWIYWDNNVIIFTRCRHSQSGIILNFTSSLEFYKSLFSWDYNFIKNYNHIHQMSTQSGLTVIFLRLYNNSSHIVKLHDSISVICLKAYKQVTKKHSKRILSYLSCHTLSSNVYIITIWLNMCLQTNTYSSTLFSQPIRINVSNWWSDSSNRRTCI